MMRIRVCRLLGLGLFALVLGFPLTTKAQTTINAATCSNTDVQTALSKVAADGTVVNVPAGSCAWTAQVVYKQVFSTTIQGQSTCLNTGTVAPTCTDNTVITGSDNQFAITTAAGK